MSIFSDISQDNLHLLFDTLTINNSTKRNSNLLDNKVTNMPMNNSDISSICATLPEFSTGDNLSTFIKSADNLIAFLATQEITPAQEFILNANIISRIKGEPRGFLNYSNKTIWTDVRPALLAKYGDRRSEDILVTQLSTTVQKFNETYDQYHQRVSNNLNDLLQHVTLNNNVETVAFKTPYFKNMALKTFCSGINEPYCEYLSHFQITSLEEALQKCIAYDNHKNQQQYMNFLKTQQNKGPTSSRHNSYQSRHNNRSSKFSTQPHNNPQCNFNSYNTFPRNNNNSQPTNSSPCPRNDSQQNFNSPRNSFQNHSQRNIFQCPNYNNNTQNFNRFPLLRNTHNQQNTSSPMSGVQTIHERNQPMSVSTRRTHNFNINFSNDDEIENYNENNFQDFYENLPEEQPPPV